MHVHKLTKHSKQSDTDRKRKSVFFFLHTTLNKIKC